MESVVSLLTSLLSHLQLCSTPSRASSPGDTRRKIPRGRISSSVWILLSISRQFGFYNIVQLTITWSIKLNNDALKSRWLDCPELVSFLRRRRSTTTSWNFLQLLFQTEWAALPHIKHDIKKTKQKRTQRETYCGLLHLHCSKFRSSFSLDPETNKTQLQFAQTLTTECDLHGWRVQNVLSLCEPHRKLVRLHLHSTDVIISYQKRSSQIKLVQLILYAKAGWTLWGTSVKQRVKHYSC